jgi:uncharacterized RDD family membrane protein YckC
VTDPSFPTASWTRRGLALLVDWLASTLVVIFFVGWDDYASPGGPEQFWVLLVYVVESALFTALAGGSFGKLATRLRTVRVDGDPRPLDLLRALARQIMVAVVVPPLIFRPDGRGLHDIAAGSATVTLETYRARLRRA